MRKIPAVIALLILLFLYASCATTGQKATGKASVFITDSKSVSVLPPRYMDGILDELQLFSGSFGEGTFSSLAYIRADQGGIDITLLNEMGLDMGKLSYDGTDISFSSPYFPKEIKAAYIVMDIQHAYYSVSALEKVYEDTGLAFVCGKVDGKEVRRVLDGDAIIEEVVKDGETVTITNFLRGYQYKLRKVDE